MLTEDGHWKGKSTVRLNTVEGFEVIDLFSSTFKVGEICVPGLNCNKPCKTSVAIVHLRLHDLLMKLLFWLFAAQQKIASADYAGMYTLKQQGQGKPTWALDTAGLCLVSGLQGALTELETFMQSETFLNDQAVRLLPADFSIGETRNVLEMTEKYKVALKDFVMLKIAKCLETHGEKLKKALPADFGLGVGCQV